jgi:hypothetical protein
MTDSAPITAKGDETKLIGSGITSHTEITITSPVCQPFAPQLIKLTNRQACLLVPNTQFKEVFRGCLKLCTDSPACRSQNTITTNSITRRDELRTSSTRCDRRVSHIMGDRKHRWEIFVEDNLPTVKVAAGGDISNKITLNSARITQESDLDRFDSVPPLKFIWHPGKGTTAEHSKDGNIRLPTLESFKRGDMKRKSFGGRPVKQKT